MLRRLLSDNRTNANFSLNKNIVIRLPCPPLAKRGSLTHSQALALSKRARDVTALRCSEPLRYEVGGPSKVFAKLCGMGPPYYSLLWDRRAVAGESLIDLRSKPSPDCAGWDRLGIVCYYLAKGA